MTKEKTKKKNNIPLSVLHYLSPLLAVAALVVTAYYLVSNESEFLWKVQELNLFLDTPLFLKQQMVTSGWLLMWLGSWFTEFLYHPWLGVSLFCAWLALMMVTIGGACRVPMKWTVVLLIPVAAIVAANVELGYWVYYLKLRGFFFAAVIGTTLAAGSAWLFRLILSSSPHLPTSSSPQLLISSSPYLYMAVSTAVLYPLIGFYGLLATLLMGVMVWGKDSGKRGIAARLALSAFALLNMVFWPLCYYHLVFYQTSMTNIWWTGLPLFVIEKEYASYYIPYYILVVSLVVIAVLFGCCHKEVKAQTQSRSYARAALWLACQVAVIAVLVYGVNRFWYKDYNFHKELRMQQSVENLEWESVLREGAALADEPTRAIVMMRNLALLRMGRLSNEMYHYKTGSKASDTPLPLRMTQVVGRLIYYNYGQANFCYRWCLEDGVEMGWRVEYIKYLIRCSLVSDDVRVARKYIDLLKHTRYYKPLAEHYEQLLNQGTKNAQGLRATLAADKEFEQILHLMQSNDQLASDASVTERFLMNQFVVNDSEDPLYQEMAVIAALWSKDIQTFWPRFFRYAMSHPKAHMPIHFQEAAFLYGHLEHEVDISGMPFDKEVVQSYNDFMALAQQCQGMTEEQMKPVFYPRFGKTFYYEYYLIRNQKLY